MPGSMPSKFEVRIFSRFGAISIYRPKMYGFTWPWPRPHFGILSGVMSGLSLRARLPNLKFVFLAILALLAFNTPIFTRLRDPSHAPFYRLFTFRGWRPPRHVVWTMNCYNRSIDDAREAFQVSHWRCIVRVRIWGKSGQLLAHHVPGCPARICIALY